MLVFLLLFPSLLLLCLVWLLLRPQPFYGPSTTPAAAASSSSSSSFTPNGGSSRRYLYKVFLSFRGEDTRHNFVSHLYKELTQKGIHTFKDDHDLKRGDSLTPSILEAISGSKVAVVVLSEHFASSTWCLEELVKIMDCRKRNGQTVVPIFYKVDPSDVQNLRGSFGEALKMHGKQRKQEKDYELKMEKWRNALTQVANIAGWDSRDRDEATIIEYVVRDISDKLAYATSSVASDLVAIGSQIAKIDNLLKVDREVHMLGIWGMGGVGKTTLANVLYDRMSSQYQACCFLGNVKDKFERLGATSLRKELLSKVLLEKDLDTWSLDKDSSMIKDRLGCKKVLIILDDVDDIEQLEVLAKSHNWFGLGSTIIITTRDKHLLDQHEVDATYEVKCLNNDDALQLFSRHAFKQNQIKKDYWGLAIDFINYAQGLPLALQVLGHFLHNRPITFWKDELQNLESTMKPSISNVLKVSFVGLEDNEKEVFLDIACFHNWTHIDELRRILEGCGLFPDRAFTILIEKSLISIQENQVYMHELLQNMGRDIVRCESNKLGKRSRLWSCRDIHYVLTKKKGTEMIKGISLNLSEVPNMMNLEEDAFVGMDRLKFLKVYATHICDLQDKLHLPCCGLQFFTDELAYLGWNGYPLKSLSLRFYAQNLIELDLSYSKVETLWEGAQEFVKLKSLNLRGSKHLTRTPDLSKAQNIVKINLSDCVSLVEVHSSIQYLDKLEHFYLCGCTNLEILPSRLDSNVLANFNLSSCYKVEKCPEISACLLMECLFLTETSIKKLPSFVESMSRVKMLNMRGCKYFSQLPNCMDNLKSLEDLDLRETDIIELPQSIENLTFLWRLYLSYCKKLESLPTNLHRLSSLSIIRLDYCKSLRSIPKLPPLVAVLRAAYCKSLENFSDNSIKGGIQRKDYFCFDFREDFKLCEKACNSMLSFALSTFVIYSPQEVQFFLPGGEIPPWICNQAVGSSINVQTPSNFAIIRTVLCCVVFKGEDPPLRGISSLRCRCQFKGDSRNQGHTENQAKFVLVDHIGSSDQTMLCNFKKPAALDCVVGDELSYEFFFKDWSRPTLTSKIKVTKCGISFLVDGEHDQRPHLL